MTIGHPTETDVILVGTHRPVWSEEFNIVRVTR